MRKIIAGVAVLGCILFFYLACVNYTHGYEVGITWNRFTGELSLQAKGGWHVSAPWVSVASVDTRPMRVCITSAGHGFNCKLVQFVPAKYQEFVDVEGFRYYWWANRISLNLGYSEEYRGVRDIFRGHAFGVRQYGFLRLVGDYGDR